MIGIGAAVLVFGLGAVAVTRVTDGSGWARWLTSFEDILGHCRSIGRLHWWAAYPESLVRVSLSRECSRNRLPERRPRWLRVLGVGIGALAKTAEFRLK
jgi:hypothetical protein